MITALLIILGVMAFLCLFAALGLRGRIVIRRIPPGEKPGPMFSAKFGEKARRSMKEKGLLPPEE